LQLTTIDFNKTGLIICSYFIFILRFEKTQLKKWGPKRVWGRARA